MPERFEFVLFDHVETGVKGYVELWADEACGSIKDHGYIPTVLCGWAKVDAYLCSFPPLVVGVVLLQSICKNITRAAKGLVMFCVYVNSGLGRDLLRCASGRVPRLWTVVEGMVCHEEGVWPKVWRDGVRPSSCGVC